MNIKPFDKDPSVYLPYPEYPYSPPITGLFHNQVPRDKSLYGQYSVYIPSNFEACSPAIMIFPPNNMSAENFWTSYNGQSWKSVADENGVTIIIPEAYGATSWNVDNLVDMRDDESYVYGIVDTIRQKFDSIPAAFNLDERSLYLVGYLDGGSAAHKAAIMWPQLFAGLVSIDGALLSDNIVTILGDKLSFPYIAGQNSDGRETIGLASKNIPLPVWIIGSGITYNQSLRNHWLAAADATPTDQNEFAQETYANGATRIWFTDTTTLPAINPNIIYNNFLVEALRFTNDPGGKIERRVSYSNDRNTGFFFTETIVDGYLRRWLTYIPTTYSEDNIYPLVLCMHGGSNDIAAFVGDSLWHETAERYGLITIFPNAYPSAYSAFSWIPTPVWNQGVPPPTNAPDDVSFIKQIVDITKEQYAVDSSGIYVTGHSSGAGMTWRLGLAAPNYFSAMAPAGYSVSATPSMQGMDTTDVIPLDVPLPIWVFMGRYDAVGADLFEQGNFNDMCINYWSDRNGFLPSILNVSYIGTGRFYTRTFTNGKDAIPIFRYTTVSLLPHIYIPYESELVWSEYFSRITMDADGKRYFNGEEIIKGRYI